MPHHTIDEHTRSYARALCATRIAQATEAASDNQLFLRDAPGWLLLGMRMREKYLSPALLYLKKTPQNVYEKVN
jgi:hypothetical protein